MQVQSFSFLSQTWQRLKKNKLALAGLIIIALAFLVAIFGYTIAPDNSPNADLQTVEIQAKKPGFTQQFLTIPNNTYSSQNFISTLINGKRPAFQYLPIKGYDIFGDVLTVNKYVDEDTSVQQRYSVNSLTNNQPGKLS